MKSSTLLLALIIGLTGCDNHPDNDDTPNTQNDQRSGSVSEIERIDDGLAAPAQPRLLIEAAHERLLFSWQTDHPYQFGNLYEFDNSTGTEILIQSDITAQTNKLILQSKTPSRAWHAQQFRVELCNASGCISSARMAIDTLVAATAQTLRPGVFILGERFAESVVTNHDASMIVSTLPVEGAVQIYFHNQTQWVATQPIRLLLSDSQALIDLSSSDTGDTLAVLIKDRDADTPAGSIRILERLGEAWVPISDLPMPAGTTLNSNSIVSLSANADELYLHTPDKLIIYQRSDLDWSLQHSIPAPSGGLLAATSVNQDSDQIYALLRQSDTLWFVSYQLVSSLNPPTWQERHRQVINGVDANDEVFLQRSIDNSSIIIAGWDGAVLEERSPVLWRYDLSDDATSSIEPSLMISDSLRTAPTRNSDAKLRFSTSESLDIAVIGWQSESGDDAQLSTVTFSEQQQRYRVALELPHALSTLAKQSFGQDVVLSRDGETLLVSTLPGSSTPSTNQAGELLIFR